MSVKSIKQRLLSLGGAAVLYGIIVVLMYAQVLPRSYQQMLPTICTYIIMAVSLNLIVGYLGDLSLGHAAFYAIGAYVGGAILRYAAAIPFILRMIVAVVAGAAAALWSALSFSISSASFTATIWPLLRWHSASLCARL